MHHGGEPGVLVHAKILVVCAEFLLLENLSFVLLYFFSVAMKTSVMQEIILLLIKKLENIHTEIAVELKR